MQRSDLALTLMVGLYAAAVTATPEPVATFGDGECSTIDMHPSATREVISDALADGSLFVEDFGCVQYRRDTSVPAAGYRVTRASDGTVEIIMPRRP